MSASHTWLHYYRRAVAKGVHAAALACDWRLRYRHWRCLPLNRELVLTTYFTAHPDPQRKIQQPGDSYAYMAPWYESMNRLGLHGVVFHDGLSQSFVRKYATEYVRFLRVARYYTRSTNDHRYFVYRRFVELWQGDWVFMTDISDVTMPKTPFEDLDATMLYVGDNGDHTVGVNGWMHWFAEGIGQQKYLEFVATRVDDRLYNAGILGGSRAIVLEFLTRMCRELSAAGCPWLNKNMLLFNYLVHEHYLSRVSTNLCSTFNKFELHRNDVPFIHK